MIFCSYTEIDHQWGEQELAAKLNLLPERLRAEVLHKKHWRDRQLTIAGKLLLMQLLKELGLDKTLSLESLKYNEHRRPYFDDEIDFNISHSGNLVICGAALEGKIGIDTEQVKNVAPVDYANYLTENEWLHIHGSTDPIAAFYYYWTRKESVLKAIGTGFNTPLNAIDTSSQSLMYDGATYYLQQIELNKNHMCHIAATIKPGSVRLVQIEL
jgi:4'-phosphopantetheinyl transferase